MFETCDLTKPSSSKQNNRKMIQQQYSNMPCKPRTLGSRNGATRPMAVLTPRSPHLSLHGGKLPPVGTRAHTSSQACVQQQQGTTTSKTKTSIEWTMLFTHQDFGCACLKTRRRLSHKLMKHKSILQFKHTTSQDLSWKLCRSQFQGVNRTHAVKHNDKQVLSQQSTLTVFVRNICTSTKFGLKSNVFILRFQLGSSGGGRFQRFGGRAFRL